LRNNFFCAIEIQAQIYLRKNWRLPAAAEEGSKDRGFLKYRSTCRATCGDGAKPWSSEEQNY